MKLQQVKYNKYGVELDQDDEDLDTLCKYSELQRCRSKRDNKEELTTKELVILSLYDEEV